MSERDMQKLLALVEKHLGSEWIGAVEWLRNLPANSASAIEARLYAGDTAGVIAEVESAALRFAAETNSAYVQAGRKAAKWLDDQVADKLIRFDVTNHAAVKRAQANQLELVQGLQTETREILRNVITDGQRQGLNPRTIARDIRDSIGLTPNQEQHVRNYRRALERGDYGNAMGRQLHDDRANSRLRRLGREGGSLTEQQIDTMTEKYRKAYIQHRAEVIARTESARNVHAGIDDSFQQAIERGDVEAGQLVKEWIAGPRTKDARPDHHAMNGTEVKLSEPFVFPDGTRKMWPGDGKGGAAHDANCRCTVATTMR
jgi:hypothetical protein